MDPSTISGWLRTRHIDFLSELCRWVGGHGWAVSLRYYYSNWNKKSWSGQHTGQVRHAGLPYAHITVETCGFITVGTRLSRVRFFRFKSFRLYRLADTTRRVPTVLLFYFGTKTPSKKFFWGVFPIFCIKPAKKPVFRPIYGRTFHKVKKFKRKERIKNQRTFQ